MHCFSETNLKCRQALPETAELQDNIEQLSQFNGNSITLFHWFY